MPPHKGSWDNDHHAVQRADKQHKRHADSYLKQRQPQKLAQRNIFGRHICEGQIFGRSDERRCNAKLR